MAWTGVVGATLATVGSRLDLAGLVVLAVATAGAGAVRMRRSPVAVVPVAPISRWRTRSWAENAAVAASLWRSRSRNRRRFGSVSGGACRRVRRLGDVGNEGPRDRRARRSRPTGLRLTRIRAPAPRVPAPPSRPSCASVAGGRDVLVEHDRPQLPCVRARRPDRCLGSSSRSGARVRSSSDHRCYRHRSCVLRAACDRLRRRSASDADRRWCRHGRVLVGRQEALDGSPW